VFTYSIANFPILRCLEQIRNDGCYHNANIKIVSVGGGFAYGALGSSHHATEDLAIMRALPGIVVLAPGDPVETALATRAMVSHDGPCYLRLGKAGEPVVHTRDPDFKLGKAITVMDGNDLTLISTGSMLASCIEAANILLASDLSVRVLSFPTVKPIDKEAILLALEDSKAILSVEEHSVVGGLGGAVSEVIAQATGSSIPFRIKGIPDQFCREVGDQDHLRRFCGLSVEDIVQTAYDLLRS
jgi:transketolase